MLFDIFRLHTKSMNHKYIFANKMTTKTTTYFAKSVKKIK